MSGNPEVEFVTFATKSLGGPMKSSNKVMIEEEKEDNLSESSTVGSMVTPEEIQEFYDCK